MELITPKKYVLYFFSIANEKCDFHLLTNANALATHPWVGSFGITKYELID